MKKLKQKDQMLFSSQNNPAAHSTTGHPPHTHILEKTDSVISLQI